MKVIHLVSSLSSSGGGVFYAVSGLTQSLANQGLEMVVSGGIDGSFAQDRHSWDRVTLKTFPLNGSYAFHPRALLGIARDRADIVHIHGIWSANSIAGCAASLLGIPAVVSPHGMLDPWILRRRPLVKNVHAALFERPLLRRAHLHALNTAEEEAALAFMPALKGRTFVVPNGVPDMAPVIDFAKKRGALFLGRLHEKKQVLELVRAWRSLPLPEGEVLTIAGWGDPAYEAQVRQAMSDAPNVEFAGALYGEAKAEALSRARFFVLPSLSEGLPMAVLEAIRHGCIPLITDPCNLPELFRDKIALRMATDFSDFQDVLLHALELPEAQTRQRGERAAAYSENYVWRNVAAAMIRQYEHVLEPT